MDKSSRKIIEEPVGIPLVKRVDSKLGTKAAQAVGLIFSSHISTVGFPKWSGRPVFQRNPLDAGGGHHLFNLGDLLWPAPLKEFPFGIGSTPVESASQATVAEAFEHFSVESLPLGRNQIVRDAGGRLGQPFIARGNRV